jgi:hypothetical protein
MTAIEMCINRFDEDTKSSFRDLYTKVDADADCETELQEPQHDSASPF